MLSHFYACIVKLRNSSHTETSPKKHQFIVMAAWWWTQRKSSYIWCYKFHTTNRLLLILVILEPTASFHIRLSCGIYILVIRTLILIEILNLMLKSKLECCWWQFEQKLVHHMWLLLNHWYHTPFNHVRIVNFMVLPYSCIVCTFDNNYLNRVVNLKKKKRFEIQERFTL